MTIKVRLTHYIHTCVHCRHHVWGSHFVPTPPTTLLGIVQITSNRSSGNYICYMLILPCSFIAKEGCGGIVWEDCFQGVH